MEDILAGVGELLVVYGLKIIAALAIILVGRWITRLLRNITERMLTKREVDPTIVTFAVSLMYYGLLTFVVLAALGQLGIQTTSFVAVLAAASFAVGLALQGALSNFAAGVLLIIFRPFQVGDVIDGGGANGKVENIQIFTTQLKTGDNKTIIIPNAKLTSDNITNFSAKATRRVDLVFGIGYGDDIDKARSVLETILAEDDRILDDPAATISLLELADSSVNFAVRPWVNAGDYWSVKCDITETVKKRFDDEEISIPFPQRDVHIYEHKA